jgi:hypothetical protein
MNVKDYYHSLFQSTLSTGVIWTLVAVSLLADMASAADLDEAVPLEAITFPWPNPPGYTNVSSACTWSW